MKRNYIVIGKVSYPQNDGVLTTFSFHNPEAGELLTLRWKLRSLRYPNETADISAPGNSG